MDIARYARRTAPSTNRTWIGAPMRGRNFPTTSESNAAVLRDRYDTESVTPRVVRPRQAAWRAVVVDRLSDREWHRTAAIVGSFDLRIVQHDPSTGPDTRDVFDEFVDRVRVFVRRVHEHDVAHRRHPLEDGQRTVVAKYERPMRV